MSVEIDLIAALDAASAVTALVPTTRITAYRRVQSADLPAITYAADIADPNQTIAGDDSALDQYRVTIDVWAATDTDARAIFDAVRAAIQAATLRSYFITRTDLYEDDTQIHRVSADWYIWTA